MGAGGQASGYEIDQSIRFNADDSAHLSKTFGSAGDRKTWTVSVWVKRCGFGAREAIFAATGQGFLQLGPDAASTESITLNNEGSGTDLNWYTDPVYRDPGAWFHIVWQFDSTQAVADNRAKLWVNGSQITSFTKVATPDQNFEGGFNNAVEHKIGEGHIANFYLDAYLAEMHFIDGTAKEASDFGEYNTAGVWVAKEYAGAYGDNGFFIDGRDSSDLGDDESGNGNDFASSGLAAADQMSDTPTNNSSIFSPIASCNVSGQTLTISDGNLRTSAGGTANAIEAITQIGPSSGKYYAEFTLNAAPQLSNQYPVIGVIGADLNITGGNNIGNSTYRGYIPNGTISGGASYGDTFGNGDVIGVALDLDNQKIWFSKNGTYQNSGDPAAGSNAAFTNLTDGLFYRFCIGHAGSSATDVTGNFGASAFATAAPTGFKALNTSNIPAPTISDGSKYFQTTLYTGTGSSRSVDQSGNSTFQPDWVWVKSRGTGADHALYDAVRGVQKELKTNDTAVEATVTTGLTAFESDGFQVGSRIGMNGSSDTFVAWQWLAGNSAGSTNDDGSVDSTVTVNTTAGFSICKYNPGGNSNVTFGHGLGVAPRLVVVKNLEDATNWQVLHLDQGVGNKIFLNTTGAASSDANMWQNTAPTSTVVSVGTAQTSNEQCIAYVFAEVEGYSSIGSYEGNGNADGTFVYTGFSPSWLLIKNIDAVESWNLRDSSRDPFNVTKEILVPNTNAAEATAGSGGFADLLSNGFKFRGTDPGVNSAATFIYVAFAENPFGGDGVAPATAR